MLHRSKKADAKRALETARTIVVVGMSDDTSKPAGYVPAYLIQAGYNVIAVHPSKVDVQGRPTYPSLDDVPGDLAVDMVDVFRPSHEMPGVARQAVRLKPQVFWMQLGLHNGEARRLLEAEGITVIQDRCTMADHRAMLP